MSSSLWNAGSYPVRRRMAEWDGLGAGDRVTFRNERDALKAADDPVGDLDDTGRAYEALSTAVGCGGIAR